MLELYMILFGLYQILAGFIELVIPLRAYSFWKKWIFTKFFPVHGILLIAGGFPLIIFKGSLHGIIFWIGIFMVLSGPFLLIYPEKIRDAFNNIENDFKTRDLRIMVYADSVIRLAAGTIIIIACIKTFPV